VKNNKIALSIIAIVASVAIVFSGCKKINEATELGGGLIPPIDNINTFETFLDIETDNLLFADTTKVYFNDDLALGHISNDPEFGVTHADAYFNISSSNYFTYPFINRDSVTIDSVILSLSRDPMAIPIVFKRSGSLKLRRMPGLMIVPFIDMGTLIS
jgi:hypothetical protein